MHSPIFAKELSNNGECLGKWHKVQTEIKTETVPRAHGAPASLLDTDWNAFFRSFKDKNVEHVHIRKDALRLTREERYGIHVA